MRRLQKIKFQNLILLYSFVLIVFFAILAAVFLIYGKIEIPEQVQDYYLSMEGGIQTRHGFVISMDILQQRIITKQEICSILIPSFHSAFIQAGLAALVLSLFLAFGFTRFLARRVVRPLEETAAALKHTNPKAADHQKDCPPHGISRKNNPFLRELQAVTDAFSESENRFSRLYADFENLSSFISHEQKNSIALLRAIIQNEYPAIGGRATAQLDRMARSLDDILTLSASEIRLEKTDLLLICGTAADEYRRICPNITFDFDEDASLLVAGHELLLYRAVSNLLDNAVKYGLGRPIAVYLGAQDGCPYISVQDHGIGIPMEQQEKIFENRYRIGSRKSDGYGIGLSLVRHAAELCGGFVWVESKENCGSKFKLVFPPFTQD